MNTQAFDSLTRRAASISRRASLLTLGGAALAVAAPVESEAKKKGKKKKKSCGDKEKKKCNNNEDQCNATGAALCAGEPECLASLQLCCQECHSADFLTCLIAQSA